MPCNSGVPGSVSAAVVLFPEGAMNAGRRNPVNPSHPGAASPLPAMTDDRHADALRVTRRERRREYQGTGGRDEEAPAPEGAEAPRRHETANPRIRGEDTALRAVKYPHIGSPPKTGNCRIDCVLIHARPKAERQGRGRRPRLRV